MRKAAAIGNLSKVSQVGSTDQGGGKRRGGIARFFDAVGECSQGHHFRVKLRGNGNAMRIFGYLGFVIVWLLAPAPIAMAETAPVVAPDTTQSPSQPTPAELDLLNLLD
jgi:hypothetical protein